VGNDLKLDQIKADIIANNICPDLAQGATQLVMGHGNPEADIVFIGEAPGKNEDLHGIPFVGAAGKLLDEMLEANGVQRQDVYITNIVKYRPPNNRDPLPEEKRAFWPYLLRELKVIKPRVVVTLGRHSMEFFLPGKQISLVHGHPFKVAMSLHQSLDAEQDHDGDVMQGDGEKRTKAYREYALGVSHPSTMQGAPRLTGDTGLASGNGKSIMILVPLYHPAAALYNGSLRQTLFDDFTIIRNYIN